MIKKLKTSLFCILIFVFVCTFVAFQSQSVYASPELLNSLGKLISTSNSKYVKPKLFQWMSDKKQTTQGYLAVEYERDSFLAVGTNGRLDRISLDKQIQRIAILTTENLLNIFVDEEITLICGTGGTILYSFDGKSFLTAKTETTEMIYDIAIFKDQYLACSAQGVILISDDGMTWKKQQLATTNNIISIEATDNLIMAVTAESDIITSADGLNWHIDNFNKTYDGYNEAYRFTGIKSMGDTFSVFGQTSQDLNIPFIMDTSTDGSIWASKPLAEISGLNPDGPYSIRINAVKSSLDQILVACNKGRILTVTDCYSCNKIDKYLDVDLNDLAFGNNKLIIVGDAFSFDILGGTEARQDNIKAAQAYLDLQNGAAIIDVRSNDEYKLGHIKGCLHIPVEEIGNKLQEAIPNKQTKIIFYCKAGSRAQTALETALALGYQRVYNLGGFSDWPFETE